MIIYKEDYDKLKGIKTIYEINIINYYGIEKYKEKILNNRYILISIIIGLAALYFLSCIIFNVEIVTNDKNMKDKLNSSLKEYGIEKYKFKKSYNKIQYIKKDILSKYKNEIEWIEIENVGTKYIVKYEPRIINQENVGKEYRNIVAKKDAVIRSINVSKGQIKKYINTYVKAGDVIVSGYIYLNDSIKDTESATGKVYGEVWYTVTVDYPFKYSEEIVTGNKKNVLTFKFLNDYLEILSLKKYKTKITKDKTLLKSNLLPIKFIYQEQIETIYKKESYNEEQLINKAVDYSNGKIKNNLKDGEYISNYKVLNKEKKEDSIELNIFYSIVEDITEYQKIDKYEPELSNE